MNVKKQNFESAKKHQSVTVDLGFTSIRPGEFIHIDARGEAIEIRMDDEGNVGVCVSSGVKVASFEDVYGS